MTTDGRVIGEAALALDQALKLSLSVEDGRHDPGRPVQSYGKLGATYSIPFGIMDLEVDVV